MSEYGADRVRDTAILVARLLLVALFIHGGWGKLIDFSATVGAMAHRNLPLPWLAAVVAVVMELPMPIAVALGIWTRPLAILLAVYTVATTFIGHPYWEFEGAARRANEINFYKNWSIVGGFLLLYVTGAGRYAVEASRRRLRFAGSERRDHRA